MEESKERMKDGEKSEENGGKGRMHVKKKRNIQKKKRM